MWARKENSQRVGVSEITPPRVLGDSRDARLLGALGAFGAQGFGVGGEGRAQFLFGEAGCVAGSDEGGEAALCLASATS